ncbi:MAG: hypothetical protein ACP5UV_07220 [Thermoplasmata archaeon]
MAFDDAEVKGAIKKDLEVRYKKITDLSYGEMKHDSDLHEYSVIVKYKVRNEDRNTVYYMNEDGKIIRHFNL